MALGIRQQLAYCHTVNLWSVTRTIDPATGIVGEDVYTKVYSGVKCRYRYTQNLNDPIEGIGRVKRPTEFTTDFIAFDSAQVIGDDWIVQNVTLLPDGSKSVLYGDCHRILGAGDVVENAGNRRSNKQTVMAQQMEHPPDGVS